MSTSATIVNQYYTGIFRQAPSAAVSTAYQSMSNDAAALNSMLSAANLQVDPVVRLYQTAFNRLPDNAGFTAWVVPFSTNRISLQQIANGFTTSTEFTTLYPPSLSNAQYVGALYWNILQRAGEDAGIKGWTDALNSGALTRAQVLLGFSESTEFKAKVEPAVNNFLTSIANTPVADQGNSALYTGTLWDQNGGAPLNTFTLTTGIDAPGTGAFASGSPAGSSVIYGSWNGASGNTFNAGDQINATGTNNTLNLSDGGSGGTATLNVAATVAGVNKLKINSGETVVANVKSNVAGFKGLTELSIKSVSGGNVTTPGTNLSNVTTITVDAVTDVNVTDNAYGAATGGTGLNNSSLTAGVTVLGGRNIIATEGGTVTAVLFNQATNVVTIGGTAANSPTGSINVTISGSGNTSAVLNGGTVVSLNTSQTGAVSVGATTSPKGPVAVTTNIPRLPVDRQVTAGDVSINGGSSATIIENAAITGDVTISNVTGANNVTLSSFSAGGGSTVIIGGGTIVNVSVTRGDIAVGGTKAPSGTVTIVNSNTAVNGDRAEQSNTVSINTAAEITTKPILVTTTATNGNITIGNNSPNKGIAADISVINASFIGSSTYYGTGTTEIYTAGAKAVTLIGSGTTTIADQLLGGNMLSAVVVAGITGTITVSSTALTSFSLSNSGGYDLAGANITPTTANLTTAANGVLAVSINSTKSGTALNANNAKILNVAVEGSSDTYLAVSQQTNAASGKALNIANNSTGKFTLTALNDTNVGNGYTISISGISPIALGNLATGAYAGAASILTGAAPTSIVSTNASSVSVIIDGALTAFDGGTSINTVTVKSGGPGNIVKAINGGTSGKNTIILGEEYANYTAAPGTGIRNFQNITLGNGAAGAYSLQGFLGNASVDGGLINASFTDAVGQNLVVSNLLRGSSDLQVVTSTGAGTGTIVVNGKSKTFTIDATSTATTARNISIAVATAGFGGVGSTAFGNTVSITGAVDVGAINAGTGTATFSAGGITGANVNLSTPSSSLNYSFISNLGDNTQAITIGSSTSSSAVSAALGEANITNFNIKTVQAIGKVTHSLNLIDKTAPADGNSLKQVVISGDGSLNLNYTPNGATGVSSKLELIDASETSGAINLTGVKFASTGATIKGGAGRLTASGSGNLVIGYQTIFNAIYTGSGGGDLVVGTSSNLTNTASTSIDLRGSQKASDSLLISPSFSGVRASITGFIAASMQSDVLKFTTGALGISTSGQYSFTNILGQNLLTTNSVAQSTNPYGGNDSYTISNGMIVFSGGDAVSQKILSARGIVNALGADFTTAFSSGGATYLIGSGADNTAANDLILTFYDLTTTQFGGRTGAANALIFEAETFTASNVAGATKLVASGAAASTIDASGYIVASIANSGATGDLIINNLAQSGVVIDANTANANITINQIGAAGTNSLSYTMSATHTTRVLTVNGDVNVTIDTTGAVAGTVTSLIDNSNTLSILNIGGDHVGSSMRLDGIVDTALSTINITNLGTTILGLSAAPIGQNFITVNIGSTTLDPGLTTVYLSGTNSVINVSNVNDGSNHSITAKGSGAIINAGIGATTIVAGDNATVNFLNTTPASIGVPAVTGNSAINAITVGINSFVNLGFNTTTGGSLGGASTIFVNGNTVGASLNNITTINHITDNATKIDFGTALQIVNVATGAVNSASMTSLVDALNLVAYCVSVSEAGDGNDNGWAVGYTRYNGDTYFVASFDDGKFNSELVSTDIVVKLIGLPSLANFANSGFADSAIRL